MREDTARDRRDRRIGIDQDAVHLLGQGNISRPDRSPFAGVGVQNLSHAAFPSGDAREFPAQIEGILNTDIHALPADRHPDMRRVAADESASLAGSGRRSDAVSENDCTRAGRRRSNPAIDATRFFA